jgi:hypothetical protein
MLKSTALKIKHWGTPLYMSSHSLIILPILTHCFLLERSFFISFNADSLTRMHLVYLLTIYWYHQFLDMMNLSKAFDCLPNKLLINKLDAYGVSESALKHQ